MMRWFTDEAYAAEDPDWDTMIEAYSSHVAGLVEGLPPDLATLAADPALNMHDASVHTMEVDLERGTLDMVVFLYNGKTLRLRFTGVGFLGPDGSQDNLQSIAYAIGATYVTDHWGTARTQILAQEIDIADDGRFALRLRLWPFYEFEIASRDISLAVEATPPDVEPDGTLVLPGE
jgi:hypothetical protein